MCGVFRNGDDEATPTWITRGEDADSYGTDWEHSALGGTFGCNVHAGARRVTEARFRDVEDGEVRETIKRFEETGSPVITDGEQRNRASLRIR